MLKPGRKLGKYRIKRRVADGPFAAVYQAFDSIEGTHVALKIPHAQLMNDEFMENFRQEVRLAAKLDHANILPVKNASFIDGHFVIAFPLGERTLADRLGSRISLRRAIDFAEQMLQATAYAHRQRVIHCDIKPENFILFPGNRLRLTDFGIAKVALRTIQASGSGTVGYVAPEQAMGSPSFRSDVFSLGLILYRMFSGHLPEWPYEWPPPGYEKLRRRLHPDLIDMVRRAIEVRPAKRLADANLMLSSFQRLKSRAMRYPIRRRRRRRSTAVRHWQEVRRQQFLRQYGPMLGTRYRCRRCGGPVSESMQACPWCGTSRAIHRHETRFPARCSRCKRGNKLDWKYCPWCYGPGRRVVSDREYSDTRYTTRCSNRDCPRKALMPFMRYCPWCHRQVRRKWKVPGSEETCPSCGWGVLRAFWSYCPWCSKSLTKR